MYPLPQRERDPVLRHRDAKKTRPHAMRRQAAVEMLLTGYRPHRPLGDWIHGAREDALEPVMYLREIDASAMKNARALVHVVS